VAVDASGDVFVADTYNSRIVELSPGADGSLSDGAQSTLPFTGLYYPSGVAVDASGDVFVADTNNSQIVELSPGADGKLSDGTQSTLPFTGLYYPYGVAVDASGDVFAANTFNSRIVELSPGADGSLVDGTQSTLPFTGLAYPSGVAVDGSGDVFAADTNNSQIVELSPGADGKLSDGTQSTLPFTGLYYPLGVAVDASGDVFAADTYNGQIVELSPGADGSLSDGTQSTLPFTGLSYPYGVAVDASGDVFAADTFNSRIVEVSPEGPVSAAESTITSSAASIFADGSSTATITVQGEDANGNLETSGGATVTIASTLGTVSGVTDNGDGTYTATLTSAASPGTADVSATINGAPVSSGDASVVFAAHLPGDLVGDWNFVSGSGADLTGNWSTFDLQGTASLSGLGLAVSGSGNGAYAAGGWADASGYSGPQIASKTLVAWVKLDDLTTTSGSPLSLYKPAGGADVFDALDYGELAANQWMAGSNGFQRTEAFSPGESDTGGPDVTRQIAISYQSNGDGSQTITGCLDGVQLGQYTVDNIATFSASTIAASPISEPADGRTTSTITVTGQDAQGNPETAGGATVTIASTLGTVSGVTDNGDGTYTATVTSTTTGTADVSATINGAPVSSGDASVGFTLANRTRPVLTGTPQDGLVLTRSSAGTWSAGSRLTYTDQWERCDSSGLNCSAITGSTGTVYRATSADVGHELTVVVTASDGSGHSATAAATPTATVADPTPPINTTLPTVTGTAQDGLVLTRSSVGKWTSLDTLTYTDQWQRCDATGLNCTAITGSTGTVYRATSADVGHELTVAVTATDKEGQTTTADATPTAPIAGPTPPANTTLPTITGTPQDGLVLTRSTVGKWTSLDTLTYTQQWQRCDSTGHNCVAITGATATIYRATSGDVGHEMTVAVTATDREGQTTTAAATPTAVVADPTPPVNTTRPTITGTPTKGQVLTEATGGTWSSPDSLTFTRQWQRCSSGGTGCQAIAGATGYVYRLTAADVGETVTIAVTATDKEGQQTTEATGPSDPARRTPRGTGRPGLPSRRPAVTSTRPAASKGRATASAT
jgi:adhesin/invasin